MEYLNVTQLGDLSHRLFALTQSERLEWRQSKSEYRFVTRTPKFAYAVRSRDDDDYHPYILEIWSATENRLLQEADSSEVSEIADAISALYTLVKRRVFGVEKVAQELFEDLENLEQ